MTGKLVCARCEAGNDPARDRAEQYDYHENDGKREVCLARVHPLYVQAIETALLARVRVCPTCKGTGDGPHKQGMIHYETDGNEPCPAYHYEACAMCKRFGGRGFVVAGGEHQDA